MKKLCLFLLAALLLCACEAEPTVSETESAVSEEVTSEEISCMHVFGDEPIEVVGNLDVFECTLCGERKVVANGTLIGGT